MPRGSTAGRRLINDIVLILVAFRDYLARHLEVDGEERSPMAMQMGADLCGHDDARWAECSATINTAPRACARLRDGSVRAVEKLPCPS